MSVGIAPLIHQEFDDRLDPRAIRRVPGQGGGPVRRRQGPLLCPAAGSALRPRRAESAPLMGLRGFLGAMPALLAETDRACRAPMITERMYAEFDHAMRGPLNVILGEIELVLSDADIPAEEHGRSVERAIGAIRQTEQMLVEWRGAAGGPPR